MTCTGTVAEERMFAYIHRAGPNAVDDDEGEEGKREIRLRRRR